MLYCYFDVTFENLVPHQEIKLWSSWFPAFYILATCQGRIPVNRLDQFERVKRGSDLPSGNLQVKK